ncbi:hypothetical protein [Enterococcus sp. DIV0756]|uniref:hypothetical protein n=1 Tax=Enterococcus sp. DIV0756 TaxID=2774636 RepID=UPI003F25BFCA
MNEPLLTYRQTFSLKPETLEKRIMDYYQETQNSSLTIKYILALRVRFKLGAQEFDHILEDLVRYLFMNTKATRTMKRFFYYFKDYFMEAEWKRLTLRIFPLRNFGKKILSVVRSLIPSSRPEETTES